MALSSTTRSMASRSSLTYSWAAPLHGYIIPTVSIRLQDEPVALRQPGLSVQCPTNKSESLRPAKESARELMALSPLTCGNGDGQVSG